MAPYVLLVYAVHTVSWIIFLMESTFSNITPQSIFDCDRI